MQKHVSWIVALIVGLAIGFVTAGMAGRGPVAGGRKPSELPPGSVRESDLPPGTLAGLSDSQKYAVLKGVSERFGQARPQPPPRPQEDPKAVYRIPVDDSPVKGPADALVTIVESSDFECPFCKRVLPTMKQIEDVYAGKVRFVFKHNPLPFHPKALPSAMATEEAHAEGGGAKFWAMHDKLFELSPALERPNLEKAAQDLGLDVAAFKRALDQNKYDARIKRDQALVTSVGAAGTPTFFINGRKVAGAVPFEVFKGVIDEELAKAQDLVKAGTPAKDVYARIMEGAASVPVMLQGAAPQPAQPMPPPAPPPPAASKVDFRPDDPARGAKNAKVTIVLFSDFQCPFCSRVEPTLKQLEEAYKNDVRIVWKHQPLPFHPNALPAAEAAEAAREQGKFWPMHDLMFANQQQLSPASYEAWARQIGLDAGKFKASVESHRNQARIEEDVKLGNSVGASGTPTLFVNCRQIVGAQPYDRFKLMVDEELRKADDLAKKGIKVDAGFYGRICEENVRKVASR
jgi:protein-disulfide isomerase